MKESLVLGHILSAIAPRIGASVLIEPVWRIAGQITFKNGKKSYFRYNTLDLNPVGSSEIAKDKDYANYFMSAMGYPIVPKSKTFFSSDWSRAIGMPHRALDNAYHYAKHIGFPVIVKPNSGSQGSGVSLAHNKRDFYQSARAIFKQDRVMLVQKPVQGKDYRIVVLDRSIISVYERIPLNVIGDGRSTIQRLLEKKQGAFRAAKRDTQINISDRRIKEKLHRNGLSFASIPAKGEKIYLLDNANLSTGGDSIDVTHQIHPQFKKIAIRLTRDMGLRFAGVDLMIDSDISKKPEKYWVLEINAAPGLDHYAKMGKAQKRTVEKLYLDVLKHLDR